MPHPDAARLIDELDRTHKRLRRLLRAQAPRVVAKRPPSGDWSIIENVRHLIFAEQAYLGRFLPGGFDWSPVGLVRTGREFAAVGTHPTNDLEEVFAAWDAVHRPIRKALKSTDADVRPALERHLKHLARHTNMIEKLLRKLDPA